MKPFIQREAKNDEISGYAYPVLILGQNLGVLHKFEAFSCSFYAFLLFVVLVFGASSPESAPDDTRLQQVALEGCGATMVAAKKSWLAYSLR